MCSLNHKAYYTITETRLIVDLQQCAYNLGFRQASEVAKAGFHMLVLKYHLYEEMVGTNFWYTCFFLPRRLKVGPDPRSLVNN